jgi:hypothetical protein
VAEIMHDPRLDLANERVELEVGRGPVDLERREEVERPIAEIEVTGVDVSEAEMQRGRCERRCW